MVYEALKIRFERPDFLALPHYIHTFATNQKANFMKKIINIMMALLLPLSAFEMSADDDKSVAKKIPLEIVGKGGFQRSLIQEPIISYYYGMMTAVQTSVTSDFGVVDVMVTNSSTGESWYDSFDSSEEPQTILQISGEAGLYEITYTTESGDIYEGTFTIE